ncbi:MAG: nucleotidyl transferase AbiEii/AbiGii toxin family protein [Elusimicrobia bacterium]|jgi:predicted nucleotidyltransferase|nr:nucleotidyl transferase AbiEii/AbiGii toxin family protein [Elusimicrobiota bacterium]
MKMNSQYKALIEMAQFFNREKIQYVVIGGVAAQYWGEPRFTADVDIAVSAGVDNLDKFIDKISEIFKSRVENIKEFGNKFRVLPVKASNGCNVDITLAIPGYESRVMERAVNFKINDKKVRVCSAEDLIVHKALAGRPVDRQDIEGIILRQQDSLDKEYIIKWLNIFADELADGEILSRFKVLWGKYIKK